MNIFPAIPIILKYRISINTLSNYMMHNVPAMYSVHPVYANSCLDTFFNYPFLRIDLLNLLNHVRVPFYRSQGANKRRKYDYRHPQ
jgi:hypothetical protein